MPGTLLDFYHLALDKLKERQTGHSMNITPGYRSPDVEDGRNDIPGLDRRLQSIINSLPPDTEYDIGDGIKRRTPPAPPAPVHPNTRRLVLLSQGR